jgi:hypothetical protein
MFDLLFAAELHRMVFLEIGVSIAGLLIGLSTLALPCSLRVAPVVRSCAVLLGVVLAGLELGILEAARVSGMSQPVRLAVMVAGLVGWEILVLHAALAGGTRPAIGRWRLPLGLLAATITLYTWNECRLDAGPPGLFAIEEVANRDLVVDTTFAAYTDQNSRIPVYVNLIDHAPDADAETMLLKRFKLVGLVTRTAAPDARCNCHGWIFTGGRFWVKGKDVDQVLHDNRYEEVSETRVGDLIVYRNDAEGIVHTGLVRALDADGLVFIESRWAVYGPYLHQPADQCYGTSFAYYRSPRPGHRLSCFEDGPRNRVHSAAITNAFPDEVMAD